MDYIEGERILGEALKDLRKEVFLVTKVQTTDANKVRAAVEKSLKELQTYYLDGIVIQGTPGLEHMTVQEEMKVHAELLELQSEKVARFTGFSAHGYFEKALALIDSKGFDFCMLSYGYFSRGYDQVHSQRAMALRDACIAHAHKLGMGIVAMKVLGAGVLGAWARYVVKGFEKKLLRQLPAAAIRLSDKRINVFVIGMRLKEEIDASIKAIASGKRCALEDRALLAEFCAKALNSYAIKQMKVE